MKIYGFRGSNNFRKVQAVANHLGIEFDAIYLKFFEHEHLTESYMALNPNHKVPTLDDDGFIVWESNAINRYLCAKVGDSRLYPTDIRLRAMVEQWLSWELAHFNAAFGLLAWEAVAKPVFLKQEPDLALQRYASESLTRYTEVLERSLADKAYLVDNRVTLADYAMIHIEAFQHQVPFDWKPFPNVISYFDRMRDDPYWQSTVIAPDDIGQ